MRCFFIIFFCIIANSSSALDCKPLSRTDQIPTNRLTNSQSEFLQGYIQALIDCHFYEFKVLVCVLKSHEVELYNLPKDARIRSSIIAFVEDLPDIHKVTVKEASKSAAQQCTETKLVRSELKGIWFPESTVLFPSLIADPYNPDLSLSYRHGKEITATDLIAVSIGDTFPIFRFIRPSFACQIDIQASVWSFFDLQTEHCTDQQWGELMNADYLAGIPISFSYQDWSFRFRLYHISTHLGDEFMVSYPNVKRINVSYEAIDLIASFNPDQGQLRIYFGPGFIFHSDQNFPMKTLYFQYGLEARFYPFLSFRSNKHGLYGTPYLAVDCQNWQVNDFKFSPTVELGYEWSKLKNAGRKFRFFGTYHYGNGDGQFFTERTHYLGTGISFGF